MNALGTMVAEHVLTKMVLMKQFVMFWIVGWRDIWPMIMLVFAGKQAHQVHVMHVVVQTHHQLGHQLVPAIV